MAENNKKRTETKKRLKDAFMNLFRQFDYASISVTMLCKEAGLHRSTFYFYYESTDEVLREIENEILETIQVYSDRMNMFEDGDGSYSTEEIYAKNERYMIDFYQWQYSMREYLNPLLGAYGDPWFIQKYEEIIRHNILPAFDFLGYSYQENDYAVKYITGGIVKTNQDWLLHGDIDAEELVHLQRLMLYENPLLRKK